MGRTRRRNELSSSSSSETSPKHKAKRNPADADVAAMACSVDKQDDTNPSLLDVWNALKRIKNNTNSLVKDIKDLQKNNIELQKSLEFSQAKIDEQTKSNSDLQAKVKGLEKENTDMKKELESNAIKASKRTETSCSRLIEEMAFNLQKEDGQIILLETKLDDLEQYTRKFNLEICGIPEDEDEDLEDTIIKLSECLNVDLRVKDIDIIHRFKKGNMTSKPIIVRFSNYFSKDEMYRSRWKLRNANVSSVFGAEKIYINENLTARRAGLFKKVCDQKCLHQEWKIWTVYGNIFIKPSPSSRTYKINSLDDLSSLY